MDMEAVPPAYLDLEMGVIGNVQLLHNNIGDKRSCRLSVEISNPWCFIIYIASMHSWFVNLFVVDDATVVESRKCTYPDLYN